MAARATLGLLSLAFGLVTGCGGEPTPLDSGNDDLPPEVAGPTDDGGPVVPKAVGDKIRGGGFDDANNVGSDINRSWPPEGWAPQPVEGLGLNDGTTGDECFTFGFCQWGGMEGHSNFLGTPPGNPNPSDEEPEDDPDDGGLSDEHAELSVGPFIGPGNTPLIARTSRLRNDFTLPATGFWELAFDWAFVTPLNSGPENNDYAVVKAVTASGTLIRELFRIERNDLQPGGTGPTTARAATPDAGGIPGCATAATLVCTRFATEKVMVNDLAGTTFYIEIALFKSTAAGNSDTQRSDFSVDNLQFTEVAPPSTTPIDLGLIIPSPLFVFAGREATTYSAIKGGVEAPPPTLTWAWGDGSTSGGTITVFDSWRFATGTHTYAVPGVYEVTAGATAADGATASKTHPLLVLHRPGAIVLKHVCGNRFQAWNYYAGDVGVTWSVFRTSDKGAVTLPARPAGSDHSETVFTTGAKGATLLFLHGILIQTEANGGGKCPQ